MRQKCVLLTFVEAVDLIDKDDSPSAAALPQPHISLLDRFTNVFDAAQHCRHGDEVGVKAAGHQPGDGGFADTRWPPQNTAVWLA